MRCELSELQTILLLASQQQYNLKELQALLYNLALDANYYVFAFASTLRDETYQGMRFRMPRATFISNRLEKEQIERLKLWFAENEDDLDHLESALITSGHKVSMKYNDNSDSFVYTVMRADYQFGRAGYILSRHNSDLYKARAEALFIHYILTESQWEDLVGETGDAW